MKAYGHNRRAKLDCAWGCCQAKGGKDLNARPIVDRAARKTARQLARRKIFSDLLNLKD